MTEVTGERLYEDLRTAAADAGKSLGAFVAPLFNGASWKIEQLRIARKPMRRTIERVRALIAGEPLPAARPGRYDRDLRAFGLSRLEAEAAGVPPSQRSLTEGRSLDHQRAMRARNAWLLDLSDQARATRRPGQTLADRVRELRAS